MSLQPVYIIYGVSGSGKTTIGKKLASILNLPFYDADNFHPESNIKKMSDGFPLKDEDRYPWLQKLNRQIINWQADNGAVLACSALKSNYRDILETNADHIYWIFLDGTYELIHQRLNKRENHYFRESLLQSQFDTLEKPDRGILVQVNKSEDEIVKNILDEISEQKTEFGIIGLGVMGKSLAKNLISKGKFIAVYNRQVPDKEVDIALNFVKTFNTGEVLGFDEIIPFVKSLQTPRKILIMVNAGSAVDMVIKDLIPFLDAGDCIIDGGNSHYKDTERRLQELTNKGFEFLGLGVSGGEEGALKGPSLMPGGSLKGYELCKTYLEEIAAKDNYGNPCCNYIGSGGSGHYVKMLHNGLEYAEMQLIAEIYAVMRDILKLSPENIASVFSTWINNGWKSYLLEITSEILQKKEDDHYLIDLILDTASQKGTGGWSTVSALEIGVPLSTISESVMVRFISALKATRIKASKLYKFESNDSKIDFKDFENLIFKTYQFVSIINHHIGFELLQEASSQYKWNLNLSEIARIWTNGCIVRSKLMEKISVMFSKTDDSLLLQEDIIPVMKENYTFTKEFIKQILDNHIATPVTTTALNYFIMYTSEQLPANLIQAQRDYFGAHTYSRVDRPVSEKFHTDWKNL